MSVENSPAKWKLPPNLIALSEANTWKEALVEWSLLDVEMLDDGDDLETCLCNHYPIKEVCHIVNSENGNAAIVGNCCVKRFEGETAFKGTHKIFSALKKIRKDKDASANAELIEYAYENKVFSEADYTFYLDIWRKKNLTEAQERYKTGLNQRLLTHMNRKRGREEEAVEAVAQRTLAESLSALRAEPTKRADQQLIEKAHTDGVLSAKDHEFYQSLWDKNVTNPTVKQQKWLSDLNNKMLQKLKV